MYQPNINEEAMMNIDRAIAAAEDRNQEIEQKIQEAEEKIQAILLRLDNEHGIRISDVSVDTRNFSNYAVSIIVENGA